MLSKIIQNNFKKVLIFPLSSHYSWESPRIWISENWDAIRGQFPFQPVPFNINSMHFLLFKPELLLIIGLIFLISLTVVLRKFYRIQDIALYSYFLTIYILIITLISTIENLSLNSSFLLFNFAIVIDFYTSATKVIILILTLITLIASFKKIRMSYIDLIEYPWLIGLSVFFIMILVSSYNMITLYLSIEGLSLTLYILTAYPFTKSSMEAASKYYVFGAWSSGVLLFGILGIYGTLNVFDFLTIAQYIWVPDTMKYGSAFLIICGFIFKLGMFPFHMWSFDVYEGTWFPVTFFFMVVIKTGIFCLFVRLIFYLFISLKFVQAVIWVSGIGSLFIGCLGSLTQNKLKKLFIYSSISQVGFCFLGLLFTGVAGIQKSFFFFFIYIITSLGILIIILNTQSYIQGSDLKFITDLSNFGEHNRLEALALSIMLLSLAGLPPLAGFWSKLLIFKLLIENGYFITVILGILVSGLNAFVYIKLIKCLLFDKYIITKRVAENKVNPTLVKDFFLFTLYDKHFKFNTLILKGILITIVLFLSLMPFFIDDLLSVLKCFSNASLAIHSN